MKVINAMLTSEIRVITHKSDHALKRSKYTHINTVKLFNTKGLFFDVAVKWIHRKAITKSTNST